MTLIDTIHELAHRLSGVAAPHDHWWFVLDTVLIVIVAPTWTAWLAVRFGLRWLSGRKWRRAEALDRHADVLPRPATCSASSERRASARRMEHYVIRATFGLQARLLVLSLLTLPAAWLLLEIPKHIVNHVLADAKGDGHPGMGFLGLQLGRTELLLVLCSGFLGVLTLNALAKFAANRVRGRVNERIVRRLRLAVLRHARMERSAEARVALAAVAVQEVEPIGYFGGSLVAVPLVQGGVLVISVAFLLLQNAALGLAALVMLPVQLAILPRLQKRLNDMVRRRVHATRALSGLVSDARRDMDASHAPKATVGLATGLLRQMRHVEELEGTRIAINDLKGVMKGLYNYTSNLTPFFFFMIGGYLVVEGGLSLGALVSALAAYKEIVPALRELFDFGQDRSDAIARFEEIQRALGRGGGQGRDAAAALPDRQAA